ncbi:MAG: type II secretion system protein J [Gammaproteobacteria bacterium]
MIISKHNFSGMTLIEVLIALSIMTMILVGLGSLVEESLHLWTSSSSKQETSQDARLAMQRMTDAIRNTGQLLIPIQNNNSRNVLAVTLDPTQDLDGDSFADADNNKNGAIDEDLPPDNTNDNAPGIIGIDDDDDGLTDEGSILQNQENGTLVGDSDGPNNDDWLDPVVYFLQGSLLIERLPNVGAVDGADFSERVIAENVSNLSFIRTAQGRNDVVEINLTTTSGEEEVSLTSTVRVKGPR